MSPATLMGPPFRHEHEATSSPFVPAERDVAGPAWLVQLGERANSESERSDHDEGARRSPPNTQQISDGQSPLIPAQRVDSYRDLLWSPPSDNLRSPQRQGLDLPTLSVHGYDATTCGRYCP